MLRGNRPPDQGQFFYELPRAHQEGRMFCHMFSFFLREAPPPPRVVAVPQGSRPPRLEPGPGPGGTRRACKDSVHLLGTDPLTKSFYDFWISKIVFASIDYVRIFANYTEAQEGSEAQQEAFRIPLAAMATEKMDDHEDRPTHLRRYRALEGRVLV